MGRVHVLTTSVSSPDLDLLAAACASSGLSLVHSPGGSARLGDDLLAVFYRAGAEATPAPTDVRARGVHTVLVTPTPSATGTFAALGQGFSFILASPLSLDRVTSFLSYLRSVAAPPATQTLTVDAEVLSSPSSSVTLSSEEAAALRLFGEHPGRIVSRDALAEAAGADPLRLLTSLRDKFAEIGSGAQILKVPHMGYRLVGTVRAG